MWLSEYNDDRIFTLGEKTSNLSDVLVEKPHQLQCCQEYCQNPVPTEKLLRAALGLALSAITTLILFIFVLVKEASTTWE